MNKFTPKGKIRNVAGSILNSENAGLKLVIMFCGQNGKLDNKLGSILTKRWSKVKESYSEWYAGQRDFKLGKISQAAVASDIWIVQMLVEDKNGKIDPTALQSAVKELSKVAIYEHGSVHVSNLLTTERPELKELLFNYLTEEGVNTYFYEEPVK